MSVIAGKIADFFVDKVWGYMLAWLKLPFTLRKIEDKIKEKPLSKNARFCPSCDTRMKIAGIYGEGHWFKCPNCHSMQVYKTIHT